METENRLIAEFMGLKKETKTTFYNPKDCPNAEAFEVLYHSDWNWLMEVVEKIESLGYISNQDSRICEGSLKPIYYFRIFIKHYRGQNVGYSKSNSRIEAVYNACVEFIKWYNEQK